MKGKGKQPSTPRWRPDFRIASTLPDIKAVRTGFLINFVAVTLVLLLGFYVAQKEYRTFVLKDSIEQMRAEIEEAKPTNERYKRLSADFREAAEKIAELETFYWAPARPRDYIVELAAGRPEGVVFKSLEYRENLTDEQGEPTLVYRVDIGGDVRGLELLSEYKERLADSSLFAEGYAGGIEENAGSPDPETGVFPFRLEMDVRLGGDNGGGE